VIIAQILAFRFTGEFFGREAIPSPVLSCEQELGGQNQADRESQEACAQGMTTDVPVSSIGFSVHLPSNGTPNIAECNDGTCRNPALGVPSNVGREPAYLSGIENKK